MLVSILLNLVYLGLVALASPVLLYRCLVLGKYREGWREKLLGRLPRRSSDRPVVWFHAVSVGETLLLKPILEELTRQGLDCEIVISTTTQTGQAVAREKYPGCQIVYFPLDFSWSVRSALERVRPDLIVLVELELWPNFIREADRRNIPLTLINGRLGEKSHRSYRRIRMLVSNLLRRFRTIAVQSEEFALRFQDLCAVPETVWVTGSIKFDQVEIDRENPRTRELRRYFGISAGEVVFIAGSTQSPEEAFALTVYEELKPMFPELRLILVPRHRERFEEVAHLVAQRKLPLVRRSTGRPASDSGGQAVLLLDTLGELSAGWGLADIAFVGGSLTQRGGQNMIEPAAYGAAVLLGPNTWNFRDVVALLSAGDAVRVVQSEQDLGNTVYSLLAVREARAKLGRRARALVLPQQGATRRTVALLTHALEEFPAISGKPGESVSKAA
jgi:3-deoxy-D-manno-octulosonic-acid transferase